MFPGEDKLQEGIAAFQAGDRAKAHELLSDVVKTDPENEQAWYYLAASESDPALRKQYLEQVLEINPGNPKAREVLDRIKAREAEAEPEPTPTSTPTPSGARKSRIRPLDPSFGAKLGEADSDVSFKLPFQIPDAPERVSWENLFRDGVMLVRKGFDVLLRKPGVYADEVEQATWWRFWLIAGTAAAGSAILSIFNALFLQIRFSTSLFNIIAVLLTPFFSLPIALVALFAGCYASYRWAVSQGGGGSLIKHSYTVALVWAPVLIISSALGLAFNLFGIGTGLLTLALSIYEFILISEGFERLHLFTDSNQKWITAVVMVVAVIITSIILGTLLGGLFVAGALPLML